MYQNIHTRPRASLIRGTLDSTEFRLATIDDAAELAQLFATSFSESNYRERGIVYSVPRARAWLEGVISTGSCPHLVAIVEDRIVGAISYALDDTFCEKPVAVLHMFYALKEHRRSAIGRVLAALVCESAAQDGAVAFHAPLASSGLPEMATIRNLFAHAGFEPIGVIMGRKL
jgi:GNAT superfamily N-acetyltransferase